VCIFFTKRTDSRQSVTIRKEFPIVGLGRQADGIRGIDRYMKQRESKLAQVVKVTISNSTKVAEKKRGLQGASLSTQLLLVSILASVLYHQLLFGSTIIIGNQSREDISFLPPSLLEPENELHTPKNRTRLFSSDISSTTSPPWAYFYNVYMPSDDGSSTMVHRILQEQIHQVGVSYAANYRNKSLTIYYNTIGSPVNHSFIVEICHKSNPRMKCVHMKHFDEAFEEKTLACVHEYCQHNPDHRVGYMHNKGSFNSRNERNHWWRRHMTMAVTDQRCIEPPDEICDLCGLNWYVLPWTHFSGNFFTGRCTYINKLLPIEEYRVKMSNLAKEITEYEHQGRFLFHTFRNQDTYMGLDRYASEAWPGSHPSVVACDLSMERNVDFWKRHQPAALEFWNFSLAPRSSDISGKFLHIRRTLRNKATYRMREYWLLAGNLFKWIRLYNQIPPKSSWVWGFFPDGEEWWNGYQVFGNTVVESLLDPFAMQDANLSLPIYVNITKLFNGQRK
jgi:hypothetical protein